MSLGGGMQPQVSDGRGSPSTLGILTLGDACPLVSGGVGRCPGDVCPLAVFFLGILPRGGKIEHRNFMGGRSY